MGLNGMKKLTTILKLGAEKFIIVYMIAN